MLATMVYSARIGPPSIAMASMIQPKGRKVVKGFIFGGTGQLGCIFPFCYSNTASLTSEVCQHRHGWHIDRACD